MKKVFFSAAIAAMSFIVVTPTVKAQYIYAQLGATCNPINQSYGGSFEIGIQSDDAITFKKFRKLKRIYNFRDLFDFRCGIVAEYGQKFEGSAYNAFSATLRPAIVFYPSPKTALSLGPLGGFAGYKQRGQSEFVNWQSIQYTPFMGGFFEASYMLGKNFGFFANASYCCTQYNQIGYSSVEGGVTKEIKEEKIGISSTCIGFGVRFEF